MPFSLKTLLEMSTDFDADSARAAAGEVARDLRSRAAFTDQSPTSSRLPISYQTIPPSVRRLLAQGIGGMQRLRTATWSKFPGWPLDLSSDFAADLAAAPSITFDRTPVLLTHDIDSAEGLRNLVDMFLPLEEAVGARSANYIVPCAWPLDGALMAEIRSRGHEIGIHGYDHANRTPFADAAERWRRLAAGRQVGDRHGAAGYRAPSLLRTKALLDDLAHIYRYDSSIPTAGGAFPVPNNGCASARPWKLGAFWEIPLSMPRDGSLRFLWHSPKEIAELWRRVAETISASRGLVCILTHCEERFSGNPAMLDAYRGFLEWVSAQSRFEFIRPIDLVDRLDQRDGNAA
jgi:hypothetical protein